MNIYFVGIGGSGISPLAGIAVDCGYQVAGSDNNIGSLGAIAISKLGVKIDTSQDEESLEELDKVNKIDWLVYTSAVDKNHPQVSWAIKNGIKTTKRDAFLNHILKVKNLKLVSIAGTHGKTTTTAMVVWAMQQLEENVSYLVGSELSFASSSKYQKDSNYFVLETDEFDRNFLEYNPYLAVVTNIDYDHPDIYKTKQDYFDAFAEFLEKPIAQIYLWENDCSKVEIVKRDNTNIYDKNSIQTNSIAKIINLLGQHNRENGFLAFNILKAMTTKPDNQILKALSGFPGSCRRMEKLNENIFSDYAHHPTEIKASLQMASENHSQIIVIYQPHQNLRQHEVKKDYKDCFHLAQKIYWLPTYLSRENPNLEVISSAQLSSFVHQKDKVVLADLNLELQKNIHRDMQNGATIIFMGAGSIDSWARKNFG